MFARCRIALAAMCVAMAVIACQGGGAGVQGVAARPQSASQVPPPAPSSQQTSTAGPRRDLALDERKGGHTLARHVGKRDEQLRERLARDTRISAASTYTDRDTAERVVAAALEGQEHRLTSWLAREGRRPNLVLDYDGSPGVVIGRSVRRGRDAVEPCHAALVVLRWDESSGEYFVLTSYPEVRR